MTVDENVRVEKRHYIMNGEAEKDQDYNQPRLMNMNILQINRFYLPNFQSNLNYRTSLICLVSASENIWKANKNNRRSRRRTNKGFRAFIFLQLMN